MAYAAPWILILVITGSVQVLRGDAAIDAVVFFAVAALLTLDAAGIGRIKAERPVVRFRFVLVTAAALAAVVTLAPRHGVVSSVVVALVGLVMVVLTWLDPSAPANHDGTDEARRQRLTRAATCWAVVLLALSLLELYSYLVGRGTDATQYAHPAVSDLIDPLLDTPVGRVVFAVAWTATGAVLLMRGRKPHA